jgi:imidazole glycerol phosphate synthase subunit HisF
MDAKRIIPVLRVSAGQVAGPDPGPPSAWACQLELEGADGILFQDAGPAGPRAEWIRAVAGSLSIPFVLEAPFGDFAELEEALEAGADKVILPAGLDAVEPLLAAAVRTFGRSRVGVAVNAVLSADSHWLAEPGGRGALAWMAGLEQLGCGEILLRATPGGRESAALIQEAAQLSLSVLALCPDGDALAAEALLHGADGLAVADPARSPRQWKQALAAHGLTFRD